MERYLSLVQFFVQLTFFVRLKKIRKGRTKLVVLIKINEQIEICNQLNISETERIKLFYRLQITK